MTEGYDGKSGSYVSYENAPSSWTLKDGSAMPKIKYFENQSYNKTLR